MPRGFEHVRFIWQASLFPAQVERHQDTVADIVQGVLREAVSRTSGTLGRLNVDRATQKKGDYLLIGHEGGLLGFRLESREDRLAYLHEVDLSSPDGLKKHLSSFVQPLLKELSACPTLQLDKRILVAATMFSGKIDTRALGYKKNSDLLSEKLVTGLAFNEGSLFGEMCLPSPPTLGRSVLRFSLRVKVLDREADVWFDLDCPGNDDFRYLQTVFSIQSVEGGLPDLAWWINVERIWRDYYLPVIEEGFLVRLLSTEKHKTK